MSRFLPLGISFLLGLLIVPLVRRMSFRLGYVKMPRQDRWHRQPTPSLGGVAMFLAFGLTTIGFLMRVLPLNFGQWIILAGSGLMFLLGLIDDLHPLNPTVKLSGQILAATVVIFFGNWIIRFFPWPIANILLTYFWLIGISNAINLLDNMDGLAAGVSFIASGMLAFFAWRAQDAFLLIISLSMAGAILGFLRYNLPPARIFMGDSGSLFIGFTLALIAVARRTQASNVLAVFGVPVLIFLLPILDTSLMTITRILRGQSPAQGGTDHTSHRLVSFGLNEREVLLVLYGVAVIGGIGAAALEALDYDISLGLIPIVLLGLALFTAYLGRLKVVESTPQQLGSLSRFMADLAYRRRIFEILLDLVLIAVSFYLALWTSAGLHMTTSSMSSFLHSWPIALAIAFLVFSLTRVYRGVWRYIGLYDLLRYFFAAIISTGLTWIVLRLGFPSQYFPVDVSLLYAVFLFLGLSGSRATFAILDRLYNRQKGQKENPGVLLYGAGDMGEILVRWMLRSSDLGFHPLGFVDDDAGMWGRAIHGVNILGGKDKLSQLIDELHPAGVVVTTPEDSQIASLLQICQQKGIWVRVMKVDFETVNETSLPDKV